MPNMQRLTWSGITMHAGQLPGCPASHGCVRLPFEFSEKLFGITEHGGTVGVTAKHAKPSTAQKPASILLASKVDPTSRPNEQLVGKTLWEPSRSPSDPVNFLTSGKDQTFYVYRNGILIGQSPIALREPERGIPADFARLVYDLAHPGPLLVTTAGSSTEQTRSASDFTIMRPAER